MLPGRKWYLISVVVLLAGGVGGWQFVASRLAGIEAGLQRVVVPGTVELAFEKPGVATIFHEPKGVIDGTLYQVDSVAGLRAVLVPAAGGEPLPLSVPGGSASYNMGGHAGTAVLAFTVPTPGRYRLTVGYDDRRSEPKTVLTVAQDFTGGLFRVVFGGLGIAGATLAVALAAALFVFFKRRRAAVAGQGAATPAVLPGMTAPLVRYAGPGRRVAGGLLDLVVGLVIVVIVLILFGARGEKGEYSVTGGAALLCFGLVPLYFIAMEATLGATLGKLLVGVRVVRERDGSSIGWGKSLTRNLLRVVDGFFFYLVGFVMICATDKRQRLGDKVAETVVVR